MIMTVQDVVDWVIKNRAGKAFAGFSQHQIANTIAEAMATQGFGITLDEAGGIAGVVTARPDRQNKVLHISHLLCTYPGVIPKLLEFYDRNFEGYRMTALRRGRERHYDTRRFTAKLERL